LTRETARSSDSVCITAESAGWPSAFAPSIDRRFEVVQCVLDDRVIGHRRAAINVSVNGLVASFLGDSFENARSGGIDTGESVDLGERSGGEDADERRCGFESSQLDERAEGPVESGGELRPGSLVARHDDRFVQVVKGPDRVSKAGAQAPREREDAEAGAGRVAVVVEVDALLGGGKGAGRIVTLTCPRGREIGDRLRRGIL
jgi:hypothetical protein